MAGALNDGPVGERIAEGHAKFEDVGAGINRRERDGACGSEVGIADREIDDQAGAVRKANGHD